MTDENDGVVQLRETRGEAGEVPLLKTEDELTVTSAHQRVEDVVINAGINVVDVVGSGYQRDDKAEIVEGPKVIVDRAECSNIDGKWDIKADLHFEPVVKDFVYDHNITNSCDVVVNNVKEDILSTLSGGTEEHSLQ